MAVVAAVAVVDVHHADQMVAEDGTIAETKGNNTVVERFTLDNGLRVIVEEIPWVESASIGFFLLYGSSSEPKKLNGISHMLEHMLFKGTKKRSARDIVLGIESLGGLINAATSKEFTQFYARIYHKHLPEAVDILADLVFHPLIPEKDLEREKQVIIEEIKMGEDNPEEFIVDQFYERVLGDTKLGRRIIGTVKNVQSLTRDAIFSYHAKHYHPANMVVSVSGKINAAEIRALLEDKFRKAGAWHPAKPVKLNHANDTPFNPARFMFQKDVEQTSLVMGFPSVSIYNPDRFTFAVIDSYLAGGMSSRFFNEVREKRGLVYSIDSTQAGMSSCGIYTIEAGMTGKNAPEVARLVMKELDMVVSKGIPPRSFKHAREYIKGVMLLGMENSTARMSRNAVGEVFHNRYIPIGELIDNLDKVTRDEAQALATRIFDRDKLAIGLLTSNGDNIKKGTLLDAVRRESGIPV